MLPDDTSNFETLRDLWFLETDGNISSNSLDYYNDTYHKIINLGPMAVPCILVELEKEGEEPRHWFYALRVITRANPVPKELQGQMPAMAKCWIKWGYESGYLVVNEALEALKKELKKKFPEKKPRKKNAKRT
jgi:hypothetical protein